MLDPINNVTMANEVKIVAIFDALKPIITFLFDLGFPCDVLGAGQEELKGHIWLRGLNDARVWSRSFLELSHY